ncbi:MAG: arginine--tRNA ligase [Candidatus Magasanikbacteria bacterium]|nr:arginine--tRNA ligase [Candidatus Magasanikbacteria bacterium]
MIDRIITSIQKTLTAAGVPAEVLAKVQFGEPPRPELGDIAVACFPLASAWGVAPPEAANRVQSILNDAAIPSIAEMTVTGPYVNIALKTDWIVNVLANALPAKKQTHPRIMLEYSQPNTHKEYHVGHLRNACYGNALVNIWRATGRNVTAVTYNNDVGSHVAKTLWAYKKFHGTEKPPREKGRWLAGMYVEATRALEEHPEWKEEVSDVLRKLETKDKKWFALWKETRKWSLDEFHEIYKELGLKFDATFNESAIKERGHKIVDELLARGIAKESQGAIIMDFEEQKKGVLILRKSDGAGNYTTSDLALAEEKFSKFKLDEAAVVTDKRQALYFEQLFMTLQAYGFKQKLVNLVYELVTLPEGAMSSRKGNVVLYEMLREDVVAAATEETRARHPEWAAKKVATTAHTLAIAAIKFTMVRTSPNKIIVFDKSEMLSFDGYTAPYLEYTLARINSIFKKTRGTAKSAPKNYQWNAVEKAMWGKLVRFGEVVNRAANENDPSEIAKYCFDLARGFASYYENNRVLEDDVIIRAARLALVKQLGSTLQRGMTLLGLPLVKEM